MRSLGIMQGRLSTRYMDRYQSFPVHAWRSEFYIAAHMGLNTMEFILDYNDYELNPLMSQAGIDEIKNIVKESGVEVKSICADYFMEAPFHNPEHYEKSLTVMKTLIPNAAQLGVKDIVVPCVDHSTLKSEEDYQKLTQAFQELLPLAKEHGIYLNLETDLNPQNFLKLLNMIDSPNVKVNYDIGNSASLGYDPTEEFAAYGSMISDLHIKDRELNGGSVELGTGNANFDKVFGLLKEHKFTGNIIMQAARDLDIVDDFALVKKQITYTKNYIEKYLEG